jgi:hypothetical protein
MAEAQGMLLGHLVSLEVRQGGRIRKVSSRGAYLGYLPGSKTLCVLKGKVRSAGKQVSGGILRLHKQFHNCPPAAANVYEWPDPRGEKRSVGRIVAVTYKIPKGMKSPKKGKYLWRHEFGDHGERGHGPAGNSGNYPEKFMPLLQQDRAGNLYIKRVPGNKFYVTSWIYW